MKSLRGCLKNVPQSARLRATVPYIRLQTGRLRYEFEQNHYEDIFFRQPLRVLNIEQNKRFVWRAGIADSAAFEPFNGFTCHNNWLQHLLIITLRQPNIGVFHKILRFTLCLLLGLFDLCPGISEGDCPVKD